MPEQQAIWALVAEVRARLKAQTAASITLMATRFYRTSTPGITIASASSTTAIQSGTRAVTPEMISRISASNARITATDIESSERTLADIRVFDCPVLHGD
jgi:hypothetical protein